MYSCGSQLVFFPLFQQTWRNESDGGNLLISIPIPILDDGVRWPAFHFTRFHQFSEQTQLNIYLKLGQQLRLGLIRAANRAPQLALRERDRCESSYKTLSADFYEKRAPAQVLIGAFVAANNGLNWRVCLPSVITGLSVRGSINAPIY